MKGFIGLVLALVIALVVYKLVLTRAVPEGEGVVATQAISTTGVKNDLLGIARAQRIFHAEHGRYASLEELISSGALAMTKPGRDGYTYSVEAGAAGFTATARYAGPSELRYPSFAVDQSMQVRQID